MPTPTPSERGFKRQVVIRLGPDDWPLLQEAAERHGSYQAALLAGLRALTPPKKLGDHTPEAAKAKAQAKPSLPDPTRTAAQSELAAPVDLDEEIRAREAAKLLGLKSSTVAGYIRCGKLAGRYDDSLAEAGPNSVAFRGWVTTRRAVEDYSKRLMKPVAPPGN